MGRPAKFSNDDIIAAATQVAADHGPARASVARIARALRAPTGSIYHRFASRGEMLGEAWLQAAESFQNGFAERLLGAEPRSAGLCAVRWVPALVRAEPERARVLTLYRRADFLDRKWPRPLARRAQALQQQMASGLREFGARLSGRTDAEAMRILTFALAEAPLAAVRRHIEAREPPPPIVDALIEQSYFASLALLGIAR